MGREEAEGAPRPRVPPVAHRVGLVGRGRAGGERGGDDGVEQMPFDRRHLGEAGPVGEFAGVGVRTGVHRAGQPQHQRGREGSGRRGLGVVREVVEERLPLPEAARMRGAAQVLRRRGPRHGPRPDHGSRL